MQGCPGARGCRTMSLDPSQTGGLPFLSQTALRYSSGVVGKTVVRSHWQPPADPVVRGTQSDRTAMEHKFSTFLVPVSVYFTRTLPTHCGDGEKRQSGTKPSGSFPTSNLPGDCYTFLLECGLGSLLRLRGVSLASPLTADRPCFRISICMDMQVRSCQEFMMF